MTEAVLTAAEPEQPGQDTPTDAAFAHLRRNPRFQASSDREMIVIIEREEGCEPREVRGKILDLSAGGAKLSALADITLQEKVRIRFDLEDVDLDLEIRANICWSRTAGAHTWRLGCAFESELSVETISELSVTGYIDRREDDRHEVSLDATVRWELTGESSAVRLVDISTGGFCMVGSAATANGLRCRLIFGGPEGELNAVVATVVWHRRQGGMNTIGCRFLESDTRRIVQRALARSSKANAARTEDPPRGAFGFIPEEGAAAIPELNAVSRRAGGNLVSAAVAIVMAFALIESRSLFGDAAWLAALAAMALALVAVVSFHHITRNVLKQTAHGDAKGEPSDALVA